jgi:hypothetical protein
MLLDLIEFGVEFFRTEQWDFKKPVTLSDSATQFKIIQKDVAKKKFSLHEIKFHCLIQCILPLLNNMVWRVGREMIIAFIHHFTSHAVTHEFVKKELSNKSTIAPEWAYYHYFVTSEEYSDELTIDFQELVHFIVFYCGVLSKLTETTKSMALVVKNLPLFRLSKTREQMEILNSKQEQPESLIARNVEKLGDSSWNASADLAIYILLSIAAQQKFEWASKLWALYVFTCEDHKSYDYERNEIGDIVKSRHPHHDPISFCDVSGRFLLVPHLTPCISE